MAMAMAMVRTALTRTAVQNPRLASVPRRNFASSSHDDVHETAKWEKITYLGIAACTALSFYNLSKGHPHHEEPLIVRVDYAKVPHSKGLNSFSLLIGESYQAYSYLHIRNKEFPWGPDGLFKIKHH